MVQFRKTLIFPVDFNGLMRLWGQLDVALGAIFIKIMEDNGPKVKNGPQKRHIDVEWHMYCISYRFVSDTSGSHKQNIYSFPDIFCFVPKSKRAGPLWCHFGALRGSLLDTLGSPLHDLVYMRVTLESLWSNFEKHSFFQSI